MRSRQRASIWILRLVLAFSLFPNSWSLPMAQSISRLTGHISDPWGTALRSVQITVTNEETGESRTTVTADDGSFSISLPVGLYTVTVTAPIFSRKTYQHVAANASAAASLDIVLGGIEKDGNPFPASADGTEFRVTGRAFLVTNGAEEVGYGLYSYLLLVSAPDTDTVKSRELAVIQAFLRMLSDVKALETAGIPRSDLNITYLLLTEKPQDTAPTADWVLTHYDFARAKALVHILRQTYLNGPYVISTLTPLSRQTQPPDHFLSQDMSNVPSEVAVLWEQEFERRAARKDFWAPATRDQTILELRTFVANAAFAFADVKAALSAFKSDVAGWISWK